LSEGGIIPARFKLLKYYLQCCRNALLLQGANPGAGVRVSLRRAAQRWRLAARARILRRGRVILLRPSALPSRLP